MLPTFGPQAFPYLPGPGGPSSSLASSPLSPPSPLLTSRPLLQGSQPCPLLATPGGLPTFPGNRGAGRQAKVPDADWTRFQTDGDFWLPIGYAARWAVASTAPLGAWRNYVRGDSRGRARSPCPCLREMHRLLLLQRRGKSTAFARISFTMELS